MLVLKSRDYVELKKKKNKELLFRLYAFSVFIDCCIYIFLKFFLIIRVIVFYNYSYYRIKYRTLPYFNITVWHIKYNNIFDT